MAKKKNCITIKLLLAWPTLRVYRLGKLTVCWFTAPTYISQILSLIMYRMP